MHLLATGAALADERALRQGREVFARYCALCHGIAGDGAGPAARLHKPPPSDLRSSARSDEYKELIIKVGGEAMGRSGGMPPWRQELSEQDIRQVVAYLRELKGRP